MVVVRVLSLSRSHLHCCYSCNMYMVIGSWASLHTYAKSRGRERKRKKEWREREREKERRKRAGERVIGAVAAMVEKKKKRGKIVRATYSPTDNVDY